MINGSPEWKHLIIAAAGELNIRVTAEQTEKFAVHAETLATWNKKTNLTAITNPEEMAIKHFVDSSVLAPLIPENARVLDMGAGGGFPGAVLHVLRPDCSVLMVDKVRKKVSFLRYLAAVLEVFSTTEGLLPGLDAVHGRAEDLGGMSEYTGKFDVVVCRAFAELWIIARLGRPFLKPGGKLIAMKGPQTQDEMEEMATIIPSAECRILSSYCLPGLEDRRSLIEIQFEDFRRGIG